MLASVATAASAADGPGTLRVDYFHTGGQGVEILALDRVSIEPLPTPWPKAEFEARQREFQARRKQIRAENRPESEMNVLFSEEQAYTTQLFRRQRHAGAVGAFQGANYDAQAFYLSQLDCVMFTRNEVPFCRVCQRALDQVIDLYAGPRRPD